MPTECTYFNRTEIASISVYMKKYVINQKQFSFPQSIASIAVQLLNTAGKRIKESSRDVIIYFIHQNEIKMHRAFCYVLEIKRKTKIVFLVLC